jgi:hypothetical protein
MNISSRSVHVEPTNPESTIRSAETYGHVGPPSSDSASVRFLLASGK